MKKDRKNLTGASKSSDEGAAAKPRGERKRETSAPADPDGTDTDTGTGADAGGEGALPSEPQATRTAPVPLLLKGTPAVPGLAVGLCHCKAYDLDRAKIGRVARDEVEHELNRFHQALADSNSELEALKESLRGRVPADHVRILDTHCAYLRDSVFLSDVENLILNEQMSLEGSIAKVIGDFDRIFRLVQSDVLRERAVDLRDVGIRVLRNLRDE